MCLRGGRPENRDRQVARRELEIEGVEQSFQVVSGPIRLPYLPGTSLVDAYLQSSKLAVDQVPRLAGLVLRYPDEEHRQPAQQHMSPDPILQPVVDRPDVHHVFEIEPPRGPRRRDYVDATVVRAAVCC